MFLPTSLKLSRGTSHHISIRKTLLLTRDPKGFRTCMPGTRDKDQISISHGTIKSNIYFWHLYFTHISLFQGTGQDSLKLGDLFWGILSWLCLVTSGVGRKCHFPSCPSATSWASPSPCAGVLRPSSEEVLSGSQRAGGSIFGFRTVVLGAGTSTIHPSPSKQIKGDFPGGAVVKNLPANAGDTGSSLGRGKSHMPWSN